VSKEYRFAHDIDSPLGAWVRYFILSPVHPRAASETLLRFDPLTQSNFFRLCPSASLAGYPPAGAF
jgi:hypothetical protein